MATKNTAKIKSMFSSLFSREEQKDIKTILSESREREKLLMSRLNQILVAVQYDTTTKLSKDKIKEYKIESRVARMIKLLETPLVSNVDTSALFKQILFFADALELALRENFEHTAYWASMALHKSVESLWIQAPAMYVHDPEMEMALYASKLNYAHNFSNIIGLAKEQDSQERKRNTIEPDHKRRTQELKQRRNAYLAMSKTEEGRKLVASAETKATDPTSLNEDEKAYIENKERIDTLTDLTKVSLTTLEAINTSLVATIKQIETTRMQLLQEPDVEDPKLVAKVKEGNRIFREQLTRQLDNAYAAIMAFEEHGIAMGELMNHPAIVHRYAKIQETVDRLETEELERSLAELEARKEVLRKAQNSIMMHQQVQEIQRQTEDIVLTIEEPELNFDFDEEPEVETEVEYDI